ncbi:MAG: ZIP family metal transporter [Flavobacteriales bacterium]|jgi:hypothetical protein|nr:ZIP family metal transporter [Flavobacteriales bacterium]
MEFALLTLAGLFSFWYYYHGFKLFSSPVVRWLTTFSGAYLLGIVFLHILPEIYSQGAVAHSDHHGHQHQEGVYLGLWIFIGFFIQLILDYWSKGIEHGHVHGKIGLGVVVALSLHSLIETMPILGHTHAHSSMLYGIVLHKIPIALVLGNILRKNPNKLNILFLVLYVISAPLGLWIGGSVSIFSTYHNELMALVIGLLLHISTTILFESASDHKIQLKKIIAIVLGFLIAFFANFSF